MIVSWERVASTASKRSPSITYTVMGVDAATVAERGPFVRSESSPMDSPGPTVPTSSPFTSTAAVPSTTTGDDRSPHCPHAARPLAHGGRGELALLDPAPRAASVVATTDVVVAALRARMFHVLLKELPSLSARILRTLAARVRDAHPAVDGS